MRKKSLVLISLICFLSGCIPFKPEERRPLPNGTPEKYSLYSEKRAESQTVWWADFNTPELDGLITKALDVNFDLRQAYARLKQSRALFTMSKAALLPEVSVSGGASRTKTDYQSGSSTADSTANYFSAGLAASYELDLWGKIRSGKEAELFYMKESQALYETAAMSVAASVAETWIDIIAGRQEIDFVKAAIVTNEHLLKMMELRFEKSQATVLDVLQQREALASARSELPSLEAKEAVLINNLSLLTGNTSGSAFKITGEHLPVMPPIPDSGLPVDLISMRPDIRAAGLRLKAADWEISAARAARLPALSLSASGDYFATSVDDIFRNWAANLAASLTGPIFDAGKRKAEVKRVRAVAEERLAAYEETVFSAVMDVENALVNEDRQVVYLKALENEHEASRLSFNETTRRYLAGQVSFVDLQERLLRFQTLEGKLIRQKGILLKYRIALYRALGGNWTLEPDKNGTMTATLRETTEQ